MAATSDALRAQLIVNAGRVVTLGLAGCPAGGPGVEAAARHAEHATEAPEPKLLAVGRDEVELHFWSSAKYAKAFFRMSRSSMTSRSRCGRCRDRGRLR